MLDCATNKLNGKLEDNQAMKINFSLPIAIVHAQHSTDICGQKSVPHENPKETRVRLGGPGWKQPLTVQTKTIWAVDSQGVH